MQREPIPGDEHGRREMTGIQVERRAAAFVSRGRSPHPVRNQYAHVNTGSWLSFREDLNKGLDPRRNG